MKDCCKHGRIVLSACHECTSEDLQLKLTQANARIDLLEQTVVDLNSFDAPKELVDARLALQQVNTLLDQHAHDFKQLRDALHCDGSDLPQLLAAIGQANTAMTDMKERLEKIKPDPDCLSCNPDSEPCVACLTMARVQGIIYSILKRVNKP